MTERPDTWQPTACILCSVNCGIEVQARGQHITRIRGDRDHPASRGYTCEKARRLPYYQSGDRLSTPLRRRSDDTFEAVDWDTAIGEVAARLSDVRDRHGGASILYYGGGAQGNHLGGAYARATRAALDSRYSSSAFAQEKTGEVWVDAHFFGGVCHTAPDFARAEVAMLVGKNPWQTHGFARARVVLREIARDPARTLIVIDPRRSETAALADIHLQVRPGTDAFLLAALLAILAQEDLVDEAFLAGHTVGYEQVLAAAAAIDVDAFCRRAGVDASLVRTAAHRIAAAASVSVLEDLGIQQAPHSTLNSYLEKLVWVVTGNFARRGSMNLHSQFAPGALVGNSAMSERRTPVTGEPIIGGLIPAAAIPDAILTDHPDRFRALIVESSNPVHSLPDSTRMRKALAELEFSVVIDVALTETACSAHYVLPALSQYEKWECTFFTLEFPHNVFHLRAPVVAAPPGPLGEPEIHRRLVRALGALTDEDVAGLGEAAAEGRATYAAAYATRLAERPHLRRLAPVVLYETLGPTLPDDAQAAAVLWPFAHACAQRYSESVLRAGHGGSGTAPGDALFDAVLGGRSGVVFTEDPYEESWQRVAHPRRRLHVAIPELLTELSCLADEPDTPNPDYPFILSAGERRSHTANTVIRDPAWRQRDPHGALRVSTEDARRLGIPDGGQALVSTPFGSAIAYVEVTDTLRSGHITLPNGHGTSTADTEPGRGVSPNELTTGQPRDWLSGTPMHKHVPARIEPVVPPHPGS
jgi:formate dehydrogenase